MIAPDLQVQTHPDAPASFDVAPPLSVALRALLVLFGVGLSVGFCIGFLLLKDPLGPYLTDNDMRPAIRRFVLGVAFGTGAFVDVGVVFAAFRLRKVAPIAETLRRVAHRTAPLGVAGFLPLLFDWKAWRGREVEFLTLVSLAAACLEAGVRARLSTEALGPERWVGSKLRRLVSNAAYRRSNAIRRAPLAVVLLAAIAYAAYFSYVTIAWHTGVHSGFDLALENNLLWNLVHGGWFKASPVVGPAGSAFPHSASLLPLAVAPFYALYPHPETLAVVQSTLMGGSAIVLFAYSRRYLGPVAACVLSVAYLLFPAVHGANLYEFHYLSFSTFFVWLALYALEARRDVLAAVAVALSLAASPDVAVALVAVGVYLLVGGKRPAAGIAVAMAAAAYFVVMKFLVLPRFAAVDDVATAYQRLLPSGEKDLGAVVNTVVANPWYTVGTVLETEKLAYAMQMLVPLALVPLRRPIAALFAVPALAFTTLSNEAAASSIHYQFTAHWTTFVFIATVLVLASRAREARRGALWAIAFATLPCSYQYGAVFQKDTSFCGPLPFKFGLDHEGKERHQALHAVLASLPPRAKVACSAFTLAQVSSRPDAYSLTLGLFDAEYVLFPTARAEFIGNEYQTVVGLLQSNAFGVVSAEGPFALARRGQSPAHNAEVLGKMH